MYNLFFEELNQYLLSTYKIVNIKFKSQTLLCKFSPAKGKVDIKKDSCGNLTRIGSGMRAKRRKKLTFAEENLSKIFPEGMKIELSPKVYMNFSK